MPVPFGGIAWIAASPSGNSLSFTENDSSMVGEIEVNGTLGPTFDAGSYPVRDHRRAGWEHVVLRGVRERDRKSEPGPASAATASASAATTAATTTTTAATTAAAAATAAARRHLLHLLHLRLHQRGASSHA